MNLFRSTALGLILTTTLSGLPLGAMASQDNVSGDPNYTLEAPPAYAMIADLVVARPILTGVTVVGAVAFVASLPFTLLGGNVKEAADSLVADPAREAFSRCLGCSSSRAPNTGMRQDR